MIMRGLIRERPTQFGFCWPSTDLVTASGLFNASGHTLTYLDASIDGLTVGEVNQHIQKNDIEVVVSLYSQLYRQNDIEFLNTLKTKNPNVQIVILPTMDFILKSQKAADFLNEQKWLDAVILSITSNDFDRFVSGDRSDDLINMCYRINGQAVLGRKDIVSVNDYRLPVPRHDIFKNKRYFLPESRNIYVTTTTFQFGCPYQCDFCLDKEAYKKSWCRSPENMMEELEYIAKCGFNEVCFRDLTFGLNRPRAKKLCELMIERKLPLQWVCTTRVDTVDEELLTLMSKAGCIAIEFGVESGIDKTKDVHKKGTKNVQAVKTFEICNRLGIDAAMFVILGFPEENLDDIKNSLDFCFSLNGQFLSINFANMLPNTDFEKSDLKRKGDSDDPWADHSFEEQNFYHPTITMEQLIEIRGQVLRKFYLRPSYILNRISKIRSFPALLRLSQIGSRVILASFSKAK